MTILITIELRVQLLLAAMILPIKVVSLMNLSPLEKLLLEPRLNHIQASIRDKYEPLLLTTIPSPSNQDSQKTTVVTTRAIDTFIFPGAGGVDGLIEELQETLGDETSMIVDWQEQRGSILTAAYDGEAVGEAISEAILACINNNYDKIKRLHFIGISVGGFAANAAATTLYRRQETEQQQEEDSAATTGNISYATTAIHILNTDDPVPTTNDPLPNCYCLDVTNAPEREEFVPPTGDSMHSWPLAYFIWKDGNVRNTNNGYPRGVVVKVDEWTTEAMPPLPW
ncbi:hypothetical protein IV203_008836 [Nitzschia inconspicua]|uniref:Uncharacterized protein n=1 Tax=Nitzschia inconspicua TaxID=303405 RepID=A0A9K3L0T0_9STRA|nr:hypothetical protein IV203_008836 [Nitzschia inconspicua]